MYKKYLILIIPLVALIAVAILSGNVFSQDGGLQGHFKNLGGPGPEVTDCNICHDFANGYYENPPVGFNLRWVKTRITFCVNKDTHAPTTIGCDVNADCPTDYVCGYCSTTQTTACDSDTDCPTGQTCVKTGSTVKFTQFSSTLPADGTLADGDDSKLDGPCEVCHTQTSYHTNSGDGTDHYDANDCTGCHLHFTENLVNYFYPLLVGGQSHFTHFEDPKGPMLGTNSCTYNLGGCHNPGSFSLFGPDPGQPLSATDVCDTCHSPAGNYNGVGDMDPGNPNSVAYGAKFNWETAIYERSDPSKPWPDILKNGKDKWCAGCHDNAPAFIKEAYAPKVMGDSSAYGYYISGHGRPDIALKCTSCHVLDVVPVTGGNHTDGKQRTYKASLNNYQEGYRLRYSMIIPRDIEPAPAAFELCNQCHVYTSLIGEFSYFRYDKTYLGQPYLNLHYVHLIPGDTCWDSDWSCVPGTGDCADSADSGISCTACHNVHGSPMLVVGVNYPCPPMIRHGELISKLPASDNKVPAFNFRWTDKSGNRVAEIDKSWWGGMLVGTYENIAYNNVCWVCHQQGLAEYYRAPGKVIINELYTTDSSGNPKTVFARGESIQYHVKFNVIGKSPLYYVTAFWKAKSTTGTFWKFTRNDAQTVPPNPAVSEHWIWSSEIPPAPLSSSPSDAKVVITINMYNEAGDTLISSKQMTKKFTVMDP